MFIVRFITAIAIGLGGIVLGGYGLTWLMEACSHLQPSVEVPSPLHALLSVLTFGVMGILLIGFLYLMTAYIAWAEKWVGQDEIS